MPSNSPAKQHQKTKPIPHPVFNIISIFRVPWGRSYHPISGGHMDRIMRISPHSRHLCGCEFWAFCPAWRAVYAFLISIQAWPPSAMKWMNTKWAYSCGNDNAGKLPPMHTEEERWEKRRNPSGMHSKNKVTSGWDRTKYVLPEWQFIDQNRLNLCHLVNQRDKNWLIVDIKVGCVPAWLDGFDNSSPILQQARHLVQKEKFSENIITQTHPQKAAFRRAPQRPFPPSR